MNLFHEGQAVSYIGDDGVLLGTHGRLLVFASRTHGHIQWSDGPRRGQVDMVDLDNVAPAPKRYQAALHSDGLEDSLEVGPVSSVTAARQTFDIEGAAGVLTSMASAGRLSSFDSIADEVTLFVEGRIRQDSSVREVLGELDDTEQDELVSLASRVLLRDAFGVADDDE